MGYELRDKTYPLKEGEGVDDVCDKIRALAGLPFAFETLTITKKAIHAKIWVQTETSPPYGDLPYEDPTSLQSLLQNIDLEEIDAEEESGINVEALAVVASMLLKGRAEELAGVAWVIGSSETFCKWLGIKSVPVRFLELPVITYDELASGKVVLLCAKSSRNHPFQSRLGVTTTIPEE